MSYKQQLFPMPSQVISLFCFLALPVTALAANPAITRVADGCASAVLVVPAAKIAHGAAEDLRDYVEKASGGRLEFVDGRVSKVHDAPGARVFVGRCEAAKRIAKLAGRVESDLGRSRRH
jgi:hypothetical protein